MLVLVAIILSTILQITAAVLALRLVRITGIRLSWISIAIGLALMAYRRIVVMNDLLIGDVLAEQIAFPEYVALILSGFLCIGVALIGPYFQSLEENQKLRQESERKYRAVADLTYNWEYWLREDGSFIYVSPSCFRYCGIESEAITQDPRLIEEVVHPDDLLLYRDAVAQALLNRSTISQDIRIVSRSGTTRWVKHVGIPAVIEHEYSGLRGSFTDITETIVAQDEVLKLNMDLERRVVDRTKQLEATNRELEAFVYSVSHDLRAPLRHIDGYSRAIVEDYSHVLDDEGKSLLSHVQNATKKMGDLMSGLLRLSRVSRKDLVKERVDVSGLAESIADEFRRESNGRTVKYSIEPGIEVYGDPSLIQDVLVNLFDNAWKFTANRRESHLQVNKLEEDGYVGFSVRDNGAGFDMTQKDNLFKVFSRLHTEQEFKGTGVGLATIHRIVMRHYGKVWCEAAPNEFACFYVLFPTALTFKLKQGAEKVS